MDFDNNVNNRRIDPNFWVNSNNVNGKQNVFQNFASKNDEVQFANNQTDEVIELQAELDKTKNEQGVTGKAWDKVKNFFHMKSGSKFVEESLKKLNTGEITKEEAKEILARYQDGQKLCVDMVADIASGIVSVGVFSVCAASPLGILPALGISMLSGAGIKAGGKGVGAKLNGRDYTGKNFLYDVVTGGVNGLLAPVTNGLGSNLTKTIGCKLGLEISGDVLEAGAKTTLKSILLNQSIDVAGGTMGKRALALGAGMALDGALSGAADNSTRAALDGQDGEGIAKAGVQGAIGGLIMAPVIGGGFRIAGKLGKKIGKKIFKNNTPEPSHVNTGAPDGNTPRVNTGEPSNVGLNGADTGVTRALGGDTPAPSVKPNGVDVDIDVSTPVYTDSLDTPHINAETEINTGALDGDVGGVHVDSDVQARPLTAADDVKAEPAPQRVIKKVSQPIEVQQERMAELLAFNGSKSKSWEMLPDDFVQRAAKEFSDDRYELLRKMCLQSTDEYLLTDRVVKLIDICPDEYAAIFKNMAQIDAPDYCQLHSWDFEEALEMDLTRVQLASDVMNMPHRHELASKVIEAVQGLTDDEIPVFRELASIQTTDYKKCLEVESLSKVVKNITLENLQMAKEVMELDLPVSQHGVLMSFAGSDAERAAQLKNLYTTLSQMDKDRLPMWNIGDVIENYSAEELKLYTELLNLKVDDKFVFDRRTLDSFSSGFTSEKLGLIKEYALMGGHMNDSDISYISEHLSDKQAAFMRRNLFIEGRGDRQFADDSIINLTHIPDDKIDFIESSGLLCIPERGDSQFDFIGLSHLAKLDENSLKTARERGLFTKIEGREFLFDGYDIVKLAQVDEADWPKVKSLLSIPERGEKHQFSVSDIEKLMELDEVQFERAKAFFPTETEAHKNFSAYEISELAKLEPSQIEIAEARNLFSKDSRWSAYDIKHLSNLTDDEFERIKPFMNIEGRNSRSQFAGSELASIARSLDDAQLERAKTLLFIPEREFFRDNQQPYQFTASQIIQLSKLKDEKFKLIKEFFSPEGRASVNQFRNEDILMLSELSVKELKTAKSLIIVPERESWNQFDASGIAALSQLSPKELENARKYFYIESLGEYGQLEGTIIPVIQRYEGVHSFEELTIKQKRMLMRDLIKQNSELFRKDYNAIADCGVFPRTKEEYCAMLPKIVKSIGISTNELTDDVKRGFYDVLSSFEREGSAFRTFNFDDPNLRIGLTYSRRKFVSDIAEIITPLSREEKNIVCSYFGFEMIQKEGKSFMNGYPANLNNGVELAQIESPKLKEIIERMRPLVKEFSENNSITIQGQPELSRELNEIIKAFPEFITTIGKRQHKTHDYTLDIHSLKVLQGVVNSPKYQMLADEDKTALKIAALLHDITKAEGLRDATHPTESAFDTYYLLEKLGLSEDEKIKIYEIVKNHNWLQKYNATEMVDGVRIPISPDERALVARKIAFDLRKGDAFEMASILTEADMQAVKRDGRFFEGFKGALDSGEEEVGRYVRQIKDSSIYLPQSKIPRASQITPDGVKVKEVVTTLAEGREIKNTIIYLEPDMDLSAYGFGAGMSSNDLNMFVHALDNGEDSTIFQALGQIDSDALLSSSHVAYGQQSYHVFRHQGFVLDVDCDDINAGYFKDFGSGYTKNLDLLRNHYLFNGDLRMYRNYISDQIKQILHLTDDEWVQLYSKIKNKTIQELDVEYPDVAKGIRELFTVMEGGKRAHGRQYNEMLITRPKIKAVFDYGSNKDITAVPEFLRIYAAENDIPILHFGE